MSPRPLLVGSLLALACARTESGPSPGAAPASGEDAPPSSKSALPREDRAAVRKAVTEATGNDPGEDVCAAWPSTFPEVVVVGTFAHDRGCMHEGLFVGRKWFEGRDDKGTIAGLESAGWSDEALEGRERLARAWVSEVLQAFGGRFVESSTPAFELEDTPEFTPVHVRATKVLGVVVNGWVEKPSGMVFEEAYHFVEYRFGRDGSLKASSTRAFAVPGERLQ